MDGDLPKLQTTGLLIKEESAGEGLMNGLLDGAYRQPLQALKQIFSSQDDKFIAPPIVAKSESHKVGEIIGTLVPFVAVGVLSKGASTRMLGKEATPTLLRAVGEQATTGFIVGSLLTPSELKAGDSLLEARMKQGGISALTFGSMAASAHGLEHSLPAFGKGVLPLVSRRITIAALSGASGGVVDAEARSGLRASREDLIASAAGYAAFGVVMEGGGLAAKAYLSARPGVALVDVLGGKAHAEPEKAKLERSFAADFDANLADRSAARPAAREMDRSSESANAFTKERLTEKAKEQTGSDAINRQTPEKEIAQNENSEPPPAVVEKPKNKPGSEITLLKPEELPYAREQLLEELKQFEGIKEGNHRFKLFVTLMQTGWLSDAQKLRLADTICQVRNYYANLNSADNPLANKAQRSWALSQAAVAEVIHNTIIDAQAGIKPQAAALEEKILVSLFSQFRKHEDIPYRLLTPEKMRADREIGTREIMSSIGYPAAEIDKIAASVRNESLAAQPLDLVKYDQEGLRAFEPSKRGKSELRSPKLSSAHPIQEKWKALGEDGYEQADGTFVSKWKNRNGYGEVKRDVDGNTVVVNQKNQSRYFYDSDGNISRAQQVDDRNFSYNKSGNLNRVESQEYGTLYKQNGTWYKDLGIEPDGTPRSEVFWKGRIVADDNGSIRLIKDDRSAVWVLSIDGSETWHPERGRAELKSADYAHEEEILRSKVEASFTNPERLERMSNLLRTFETEAAARGLGKTEMALFYRQLNRLLTEKPGQTLDIEARRDLSEQAVNHAAFPTTIDQGGNNTCNVTTIENRIYTRSPSQIGRMLAEIADTGRYTTSSGEKIDLANSRSSLKPDAEARQSMKMQAEAKSEVKADGDRDWASQIAQNVMIKIKHLQTTELISHDTIVEPQSMAFNQDRQLLGKVSKNDITPLYDKNFKRVFHFDPNAIMLKKTRVGDFDFRYDFAEPEEIVYDSNGDAMGVVSDPSKIQRLHDAFGNQRHKLTPGTNYFDENGKLVLYQSAPGDITYDKLQEESPKTAFKPGEERERLHVRHLGKTFLLKEEWNGKATLIDSPNLNTSYYRSIAHEVTGAEAAPFSIARGPSFDRQFSVVKVSTASELEQTIMDMKDNNNLPAILRVHTANPPWGNGSGGWHVVNIQDYEPTTTRVKITNQWGSKFDFMETGILLNTLFVSMRR